MQQRRRHRRHTAAAQGTYQGVCLVHAHAQLALYNQQQSTTFISSHACSRGDDTRDTLQPHKACTKAHASSIPMHNRCNEIKNKSFIKIDACSTSDDTGDTLQLHKACTKALASSMPVHNRCNEIKNRSFINIDACSRGHGTRDALQLHKACTKARASSMHVHNRCNEIKNRTQHLLAVMHKAEATTQETHYNSTRHAPWGMPRPCLFIAGVI